MALNANLFANPQLFQAYQSDPRLGYAQGLMQQGASTAPVRSPLEGLARALQGGVGGYFAGETRRGYEKQGDQYRQGLAEALKGGDVIGNLSASNQPMLQQLGLEARLKQATTPAEKDPLVKVFDPGTGMEKWVKTSEAAGMQASGPQGPNSTIAKIQADLKAGLITPEQAQAAVRKETYIAPVQGPQDPETIRLLRMAGIDPASPEGQSIIRSKLAGSNGITIGADGSVQIGGPAGKLTEVQGAATAYGNRMWEAEKRISKLTGANPTDFLQSVAAQIPVGGNYMLSPEYQQYKQAATDWIRAKLRKESGAVISDQELDSDFQTFFPQPGDKDPVIAQKAEARKTAFEGLVFQAGPGASNFGSTDSYGGGAAPLPAAPPPPPPAPQAPPPPQPGAIEDGMRFKGGNPADPNSWEPVGTDRGRQP